MPKTSTTHFGNMGNCKFSTNSGLSTEGTWEYVMFRPHGIVCTAKNALSGTRWRGCAVLSRMNGEVGKSASKTRNLGDVLGRFKGWRGKAHPLMFVIYSISIVLYST